MYNKRGYGWTVKFTLINYKKKDEVDQRPFNPVYRLNNVLSTADIKRAKAHRNAGDRALRSKLTCSHSAYIRDDREDCFPLGLTERELYLAPLQLFDDLEVVVAICNALNDRWHDRMIRDAENISDNIIISERTTLPRVAIPTFSGMMASKIANGRVIIVPDCLTYHRWYHVPDWLDTPSNWQDISIGAKMPSRGKFFNMVDRDKLVSLYNVGHVHYYAMAQALAYTRSYKARSKYRSWFPDLTTEPTPAWAKSVNGYTLN